MTLPRWLREILANWLAMDGTPPADRAEVEKARPTGGSVRVVPPSPADARWQSCLRRCAVMPNRAEFDQGAAFLLIAATGNGHVRIVEEEIA